MILDYNYLHFVGTFDLRNSFNNNLIDYYEWLTSKTSISKVVEEENAVEIVKKITDMFGSSYNADTFKFNTTEGALKNLPGENIIISRYKSQDEINKAKYIIKTYDYTTDNLNTGGNFYFKNYGQNLENIKPNSLVMRGLSFEWPYLGMIGWYADVMVIKRTGRYPKWNHR